MPPYAPVCSGMHVMSDPSIALAVAIVLGVYLIYTVLRPERF